jgi:hypothetical protein
MIDRRELLIAAAQTPLTPHGIEKDYRGLRISWPPTTSSPKVAQFEVKFELLLFVQERTRRPKSQISAKGQQKTLSATFETTVVHSVLHNVFPESRAIDPSNCTTELRFAWSSPSTLRLNNLRSPMSPFELDVVVLPFPFRYPL